MHMRQHHVLGIITAGIAALVTLGAVAELYFLASAVAASTISFDADEANHALDGWQVYHALIENQAGFYGSQMTAMDNATRNAGDMINRLSIQYNRQRQAAITTELVEIISGAEAL